MARRFSVTVSARDCGQLRRSLAVPKLQSQPSDAPSARPSRRLDSRRPRERRVGVCWGQAIDGRPRHRRGGVVHFESRPLRSPAPCSPVQPARLIHSSAASAHRATPPPASSTRCRPSSSARPARSRFRTVGRAARSTERRRARRASRRPSTVRVTPSLTLRRALPMPGPRHRWAAACLARRAPIPTPRSASRPRRRRVPLPTCLCQERTVSTAASTPALTVALPACPTPAAAPASMRAAAPPVVPLALTVGRRHPPASSTSAASKLPTARRAAFRSRAWCRCRADARSTRAAVTWAGGSRGTAGS